MTKIKVNTKQSKESTALLDKLAQLGTLSESKAKDLSKSHKHFLKKSRKKAFSYGIARHLVGVQDSALHKAYVSTLYCNNIILQDGPKASTKYCKQRWCPICNGIRTADLINGYYPTLKQLGNLYFVTLTKQSVKANDLKQTFKVMRNGLRHIQHNTLRKKHGIKLIGIRKVESNYNANEETFNPHMHLVLSTDNIHDVYTLIYEWLNYFPDTTDRDGQHMRPIDLENEDDNSYLLELFKYASKTVTKDGFSPEAQDVIYTALKGSRAIQPMGIKKIPKEERKHVDLPIDFQPMKTEIWEYNYTAKDWIASDGKNFTGYKPDAKTKKLLKRIDNPI